MTYRHQRARARQLHVEIGRSEDEFDVAVPPWAENAAVRARRIGETAYGGGPAAALDRSARVGYLLGQLEAWARANRHAVEFQLQQAIDAEARVGRAIEAADAAEERASEAERQAADADERASASEARKEDAEARADDAERRAADAEARAATAEAQVATRHRLSWRRALGLLLGMVGIAVGVVLPLTVAGHDWGLASALIGAIALIVLGLRVLFGSKFGGEVVLILTMIAGFGAVAAAIIGATRSRKSAGSTTPAHVTTTTTRTTTH